MLVGYEQKGCFFSSVRPIEFFLGGRGGNCDYVQLVECMN